jgi:hypothetical protein
MLTLRPLPPAAADHPDPLLGFYYARLSAAWSGGAIVGARLLSAMLCAGAPRQARRLGIPGKEAGWIGGQLPVAHYFSQLARRGVHRLLNPSAVPLVASRLKNKVSFAAFLAANKLPAPATIAGTTDLHSVANWLRGLPSIVIKPNFSSRGHGVERFQRSGQGWTDSRGRTVDETALVGMAGRMLAAGGIVQAAVPTLPRLAALSPGALPTLRVNTIRLGNGEIVGLGLVLRLGGGDAPVDNFSRGGIAVAISDDGCAGEAVAKAAPGKIVRLRVHPATHAPLDLGDLADVVRQAVAIAMRAHAALDAGYRVVGWDVGLGATGPVLIEGNWNPGHQLTQFAHAAGVSQLPLGKAYLEALSHVPDDDWLSATVLAYDLVRIGQPASSRFTGDAEAHASLPPPYRPAR